MVRKAREGDLQELLELYQYLHEKEVPGPSKAAVCRLAENPGGSGSSSAGQHR